jgi:beta-phosphoglucomutase
MSWPTAVLFDFDGVIINSEPLHFQAFAKTLAEEKIKLTSQEYFQDLIGFDDRGAIEHVYRRRKLKLEPKTLLRLMTRKSEVMMRLIEEKRYKALPGVEELVRGLWRHYPLGICSGALRDEIEAMLEGIGLRDCFGVIVAAEDVRKGKPNPDGYLLCAKLVGKKIGKVLKPLDCLIIEDAPTVIKSVKTKGFKVLAVATSYDANQLSEADWVVKALQPREVHKQIPRLQVENTI